MPTTIDAAADDARLELLVEGAFALGIPGLEQAFVAGMLVGESPIARERMLDNPRVVLGMARTALTGGLVVPPFLVIHYFKALIQWIEHKLGRSAAHEIAKEAGKEVAERLGADAAKNGWTGAFKRLGVLGVEALTVQTLVPLIERILEEHGIDDPRRVRLQTMLDRLQQGAPVPDREAEQLERIMTADGPRSG